MPGYLKYGTLVLFHLSLSDLEFKQFTQCVVCSNTQIMEIDWEPFGEF